MRRLLLAIVLLCSPSIAQEIKPLVSLTPEKKSDKQRLIDIYIYETWQKNGNTTFYSWINGWR